MRQADLILLVALHDSLPTVYPPEAALVWTQKVNEDPQAAGLDACLNKQVGAFLYLRLLRNKNVMFYKLRR